MLKPIGPEDFETAVELLVTGFPKRDRRFWRQMLERMVRLGCNARAGVPFGYLLLDGATAKGVVLTPATMRTGRDGKPHRIINMSSWYVDPSQRWRAIPMLRAVMRQNEATYTDLTPTPEVRRILEGMGFTKLNDGITVHLLGLFAAGSATGARLIDFDDAEPAILAPETRDLLERHRAIGCLPVLLIDNSDVTVLMFRRRTIKSVPAATLVYCDNHALLDTHFATVARYLLRKGVGLLVTEDRTLRPRMGSVRRHNGVKFAKPASGVSLSSDRTDFAGSELCLIDF